MRAAGHFQVLATLFATAIALPATTDPSDYGYWSVNVTSSNDASGYRYGDVYAEYSSSPGQISHFSWLYSPAERNPTSTTDNPAFNSSIVDGQGDHTIELKQTVELNHSNVTLVGTSTVSMKCGLGGNGRGCAGSTTVTATPA
ncbi:hypothetical protein AB5N19_05873 [Seiridium cardinale]